MMARAREASPGWLAILSLAALLAWAAARFFLSRNSRHDEDPARAFGVVGSGARVRFHSPRLTGRPADQLDMQAVIICGAVAITLVRIAVRMRHAMFSPAGKPRAPVPH